MIILGLILRKPTNIALVLAWLTTQIFLSVMPAHAHLHGDSTMAGDASFESLLTVVMIDDQKHEAHQQTTKQVNKFSTDVEPCCEFTCQILAIFDFCVLSNVDAHHALVSSGSSAFVTWQPGFISPPPNPSA